MQFRFRKLGALCVLAIALTQTAFRQQDEEKTPLGKKMAAMNTAFKAVGRQIDDPAQNASTLEKLTIIETNAKAALTLEPEKKAKTPAAEQAKFMADYQAGIKDLLVTVGKLRAVIKAGKNSEAGAILDEMKKEQKEGHAAFRLKKAGAPGV